MGCCGGQAGKQDLCSLLPTKVVSRNPPHVAAELSPSLAQSEGTAGCGCSAPHSQSRGNRFSIKHRSVFKSSRAVLEDISRGDPLTSKGEPVLSPRAWEPPLVSTQPRARDPTQQRQQNPMATKQLSHPGSELSPVQQHPIPVSPSSSISPFPAKRLSTSLLPCPLEVSDGVGKCEGGSEKLAWPHAALMCGHLEAPDRGGGTEAREVAEEKEERQDQKAGEGTQESCG